MNLSEKILKLRKVNGLSQDELAEKLNVSRQAISKWETDQSVPELDNILAIAKVFDITTDYLLQPNTTDELFLKTAMLEKQQQEFIQKQHKRNKWQFLVISCISAIVVMFVLRLIGYYIQIPNFGISFFEDDTFYDYYRKEALGFSITLGGWAVVICTTIVINWLYWTKKSK